MHSTRHTKIIILDMVIPVMFWGESTNYKAIQILPIAVFFNMKNMK
jgi:hypothetical protein